MNTVSKENKKFYKYLSLLFIISIITHRLPHDSYSIIQYIIRPIYFNSGYLHLAGLVPLILIIISFRGLFQLERYKYRNKIGILLIYFIIITPVTNSILDTTITSYYWLRNNGLKTMDIKEEEFSIFAIDNSMYLNIELELIDYGRSKNEFAVRVFPPKSLQKYTGIEYYELEENYRTFGNKNNITIKKQMKLEVQNNETFDQIMESKYYWEDVKYELYNSEDSVQLIHHGI